MDFSRIPVGYIILVLALVWLLQLFLALLQSKRFNRRISQLRRYGTRTSVGLSGSTWRRKVYAVIVLDESDVVVRAEKLSGYTVFADPVPVPELTGRSLEEIRNETIDGISSKVLEAFRNAASYVKETIPADNNTVMSENMKKTEKIL